MATRPHCSNFRRAPQKLFSIMLCILMPISVIGIFTHFQKISYLLRPLCDKPPPPFKHIIPHSYAENVLMKHLCYLHGWSIRSEPCRVSDGIIFSNEIDILEVRWCELYPYITKFVILESNITFTGIPKPLLFASSQHRFAFADDKIVHGVFQDHIATLGLHKDPFIQEAQQWPVMNRLIRSAGISNGDLLIISDTDEIPKPHTV